MSQRVIPSYLLQVKQFPLVADMTTTLTVNTAEVENKTNITCQTQKGIHFLSNFTFLYIAGYIELHHNNLKSSMCIELFSLLYM